MGKYKSYTDVKQNMVHYKMRTSYAGLIPINQVPAKLDTPRSTRRRVQRETTKPSKPKPVETAPPPEEKNAQAETTSHTQVQLEQREPAPVTVPAKKRSCCTIM